jgi:hypothetical protein
VTADELVGAALRGESVPWPVGGADALEAEVLDAIAHHGVAALLAGGGAVAPWPDPLRTALTNELRREAAAEVIRRKQLQRLLAGLGAAGVRPLLMKGAQLAYTHYPQPWLRPRLDTDVLVAPEDRERADRTLRELGYRPGTHFDGELVTHQFHYERSDRYGLTEHVDLHWKIANPHAFAGAFTFEELERRAVPIAVLGPNARGLSDPHALVLACIHRVAHHYNSDRLIWLHDIHLLATAMSPKEQDDVVDLARVKLLGSVCANGLAEVGARLATAAPPRWRDRLQTIASEPEPTSVFLRAGRTKLDVLRSDLHALKGWRPRMRMLREHLFPPAAYIRQAYNVSNPAIVPFAYAYRIASGVGNWVRRH